MTMCMLLCCTGPAWGVSKDSTRDTNQAHEPYQFMNYVKVRPLANHAMCAISMPGDHARQDRKRIKQAKPEQARPITSCHNLQSQVM